jgi:hypothetical protein
LELNPILFRTTSKFLSLLRHDETTNHGSSRGTSTNEGETWGGGDSILENTGTAHGTGKAVAHNTSTTGTATTGGELRGTAGSWNNSVHKRPLIPPMKSVFTSAQSETPKAKGHPGLALVLASGQKALAIRRANYFLDRELAGCLDAHPDHPG